MPIDPILIGLLVGVLATGIALLAALALRFRARARSLQARLAPIIELDNERQRLTAESSRLQEEIGQKKRSWESDYSEALSELESLTAQLDRVRDTAEIQSFGIYEPKYDLATADEYKERLDAIRTSQKAMVREKTAAVCHTQWSIDGRRAEGRKMTNRQLKLMLRAFNGECDAAVQRVKYSNFSAIESRIYRAFDAINKLGEPHHCELTREYLDLKTSELSLAFEYAEKRQWEKEEQRAHREEMREEEKARREYERARSEAEREEEQYTRALERARREVATAAERERDGLDERIRELEQQLEDARARKQRAISMAELTRAGHVYVISNRGSFGEQVFKVGLTRRLQPLDRVRELGDASVPFRFDVHALIYSENAPQLERELHEKIRDYQINRVNNRKEFFRLSMEDMEKVVREHCGESVQFNREVEAEEFRKTREIERVSEASQADPAEPELEEFREVENARSVLADRLDRWR